MTLYEIAVAILVIYLFFKLVSLLRNPPKEGEDEAKVQEVIEEDVKFDPVSKKGIFDLRKEIPRRSALEQDKLESEKETQEVIRDYVGGDKEKPVSEKMEMPHGRIKDNNGGETEERMDKSFVLQELIQDREETVEKSSQLRQEAKSWEQEREDKERHQRLGGLVEESQEKQEFANYSPVVREVRNLDVLDDDKMKDDLELEADSEEEELEEVRMEEERLHEELAQKRLKEREIAQLEKLEQERKDLFQQEKERIERERLRMEQEARTQTGATPFQELHELNLEKLMNDAKQIESKTVFETPSEGVVTGPMFGSLFQQENLVPSFNPIPQHGETKERQLDSPQALEILDDERLHEEYLHQRLKDKERAKLEKLEQERKELFKQELERIETERLNMQKQVVEEKLAEKENLERMNFDLNKQDNNLDDENLDLEEDEEEESEDFATLNRDDREKEIERRAKEIEEELLEETRLEEELQEKRRKGNELAQLEKLELERQELERQEKERIEKERFRMEQEAQAQLKLEQSKEAQRQDFERLFNFTETATPISNQMVPTNGASVQPLFETLYKQEAPAVPETIDQRVQRLKKNLQANQVADISKMLEQDQELSTFDFSKSTVLAQETGDLMFDNIFSVASAFGNFETFQQISARLKNSSVQPTKYSLYNACRNGRARICAAILANGQVDEYERYYTFYQGSVFPLLLRDKFKLDGEMKRMLDVPVIVESPLLGYHKNRFTVHLIEGKNLAASSSIRPAVKIGFHIKGKNKMVYQWELQSKKLIAKASRNETNPKWDEKFTIVCPPETVLVDQSKYKQFGYWGCELTLEIWDKHRIQKSTLLDTIYFDIDEINKAIFKKRTITRELPSLTNASITVGFPLN